MDKVVIIRAIALMGDIVGYIIWARVLMSIFVRSSSNIFYNFLVNVTEPILYPLRKLQFKMFKSSMLDFSPIFAWCLIDYVIVPLLVRLVNYILL